MSLRFSDWIQLGSLIIGAIGIYFLVKYVEYTKRISVEAVRQTEASFKPAVIAVLGLSTDANSKLRNVGNGPAINVEWRITNTSQGGRLGFLEAGEDSPELQTSNLESLVVGALKSPNKNDVALICSYESLSGAKYTSTCKLDSEGERFDVTLSENR